MFLNVVVLLPAGVFYVYQRERGLPRDLASLAALARGTQGPGDREPLVSVEEKESETEAAIGAAEFEGTVQYPLVERNLREFFRQHVSHDLAGGLKTSVLFSLPLDWMLAVGRERHIGT